ncbi:hypothetical protein [Microvirga arabica]|uniref:hypothetical protein n=1 Tax=Microvirga arabica TaxID=1128671 RepID=UPI00193A8ECF|nr:hypothetical protein [Microvirga arabica]MBM1170056.1 hypothetical protein [Microvirga arabica]
MPDHSHSMDEALSQRAVHQQDEQMTELDVLIDRLKTLNRCSDDLVHAICHMMD